jgi:hypothetical protein
VKRIIYWLILIIVLYALLEVTSLLGLSALRKIRPSLIMFIRTDSVLPKHTKIIRKLLEDEATYVKHSAALGWSIKGNGVSDMYHANSQGLRADEDYAAFPADGIIRIASLGDSFTHCDDVQDAETWQQKLTRLNNNLEVLNFGVGGFGLDQAFLRYETEGADFHPHIVLIGFMPENIFRHVNVYRPFYAPNTNLPLSKPRFVIEGSKLTLIENPMSDLTGYHDLLEHPEVVLPQLGRSDFYYQSPSYFKSGRLDFLSSVRLTKTAIGQVRRRIDKRSAILGGYYNTDSEAYKLTLMIFDEFVRSALKGETLPIIVVFPDRVDVARYRRDGKRKYDPLLGELEKRGYDYVDLTEAFDTRQEDTSVEDLVLSHYTPRGNERVAEHLNSYLKERRLLDPDTIRQALQDAGSKIK